MVFLDELDEGNFHVQTRSKLLERAPEIVPMEALAEMDHEQAIPAPLGPPSLTAQAWSEAVAETQGSGPGGVDVVAVVTFELEQRSLTTVHANPGAAGHTADAERDQARLDRRFARSTAQLTPAIFAEEMQRRVQRSSTARVEEVEPVEPEPDRRPTTTAPTSARSRPAALQPAVPAQVEE